MAQIGGSSVITQGRPDGVCRRRTAHDMVMSTQSDHRDLDLCHGREDDVLEWNYLM